MSEEVFTLYNAGISAVLLKGAALAETVYMLPVLQHSHYLDILFYDNDLSRAVALLPSLGFAQSGEPIEWSWKKMNVPRVQTSPGHSSTAI